MTNPTPAPVADGLRDITTRTVVLDGGKITVEHFPLESGRVEMTVRIGGVLRGSLILSEPEGEALGMALARPYGWTMDDVFKIHDRLGCSGGAR